MNGAAAPPELLRIALPQPETFSGRYWAVIRAGHPDEIHGIYKHKHEAEAHSDCWSWPKKIVPVDLSGTVAKE